MMGLDRVFGWGTGEWWWWLVDGAVKGFLVLGVAWLVARRFRHASAATRHLIWTLGVLAVLLLPLFAGALPSLSVEVPGVRRAAVIARGVAVDVAPVHVDVSPVRIHGHVRVHESTGVVEAVPAPVAGHGVTSGATPRAGRAATVVVPAPAPAARGSRVDRVLIGGLAVPDAAVRESGPWSGASLASAPMLFAVWAGVALLLLAPLGAGGVRVAQVRRGARVVRSGRAFDIAQEAARALGIRRRVCLLSGDADVMPMTWGVLRPVVLLPETAALWSRSRLEMVLWHELAHVARGDALSQLAADLICALHWFNPLAWIAAHRMRTEREHACDDLVLEAGCRPSAYAWELLDMARTLQVRAGTSQAAIAMARTPHLKRRVLAVLDERVTRRRPPGLAVAAATIAALLVVLPLAALEAVPLDRPVAEATLADVAFDVTPEGLVLEPPTEFVDVVEPSFVEGAAHTVQLPQSACPRSPDGSASIARNNDTWVIHWTGDDCRVDVRIEGDIRYDADFTQIAGLTPRGRVEMRERSGSRDSELLIREDGGSLRYTWRVNGAERAFDDAGQSWLSGMLLTLFRTTGLAAEERVAWMLRTQGADAVLAEIGHLTRDWARRIYYTELLNQADLPPGRVAAIVRRAGTEIESDHELSSLLVETVGNMSFDRELSRAVIDATLSIDSDHNRSRALTAVLEKGELAGADVAAVLASAASMESDHTKGSLLIDVAERYTLEPAVRASYLQVAASIESDHEAVRVLAHLLEQGSLAADEQAAVLNAATHIESDHERGRLLTGVSESALRSTTLQRAYLDAAAALDSDSELARTLGTLLESHTLEPATLRRTLDVARGIGSDGQRANVLLRIVETQRLDENTRAAVEDAANGIGSRGQRERVLNALRESRDLP